MEYIKITTCFLNRASPFIYPEILSRQPDHQINRFPLNEKQTNTNEWVREREKERGKTATANKGIQINT